MSNLTFGRPQWPCVRSCVKTIPKVAHPPLQALKPPKGSSWHTHPTGPPPIAQALHVWVRLPRGVWVGGGHGRLGEGPPCTPWPPLLHPTPHCLRQPQAWAVCPNPRPTKLPLTTHPVVGGLHGDPRAPPTPSHPLSSLHPSPWSPTPTTWWQVEPWHTPHGQK